MRVFVIAMLATVSVAASATTVFADPPPSLDHQRCTALLNAKYHTPESVALGPLDAVSLRLGCPVG